MTDWESRYQAGDMPWEKGSAAPPLLELLEMVVLVGVVQRRLGETMLCAGKRKGGLSLGIRG